MKFETTKQYHPRKCTQCGGINPGYHVVTSHEFPCKCLDKPAKPSRGSKPLEGSNPDIIRLKTTVSMPDWAWIDINNKLLDKLIRIADSSPLKSLHVDTLKKMRV